MTTPIRRDALLRLKIETDLARAVETTAREHGQTVSEYVRQGLRLQLARHGVRLSPDDGPGPSAPAAAMKRVA
jgi:hypothetical protein